MKGKQIASKVVECIDFAKLTNLVIDDVLEASLDKVVAESNTPWDDQIKALVWPLLEKEVKEQVAKAVEKLKASLVDAE